MVQIQELEEYKKQLHSDIDRLFDTTNQDRRDFTMEEFKQRSTKFLKGYYRNTVKTSDSIFSQDPTVPDVLKVRNAVMKGNNRKGEQLLDEGVFKVLEVATHLTHSGTEDFRTFNKAAAQALNFIFAIYMRTFSHKLPNFINRLDEDEIANNDQFLLLKRTLDSFGYELVKCFERSKINHQWKLPLTMIFLSEMQENSIKDVAHNLALEKTAFNIAKKIMPDSNSDLDPTTIMNAIQEAKKEMEIDGIKKREEMVFYFLLKVTTDLYLTNLESFLAGNVLNGFDFSEDTKRKIADIKTNLFATANQTFNRIK